MRLHQTLPLLIAVAASVAAQNPKSLTNRLATQNALFEEQYESDLRNFPERATAFGDYRYNDKLADYSLEGVAARHRADLVFLAGESDGEHFLHFLPLFRRHLWLSLRWRSNQNLGPSCAVRSDTALPLSYAKLRFFGRR